MSALGTSSAGPRAFVSPKTATELPVIRGEFERRERARCVPLTRNPVNLPLGGFPSPVRRDRLRHGGPNLDSGGGRQ
ncbi:hypothetical protein [Streptomyces celluloflavus]|uniref:Uncharacterized protein n=1 Tax=Streptomyces celluloflavus TaxID=58344 RepID=A0ABW7RKI2_9ACTN|nr:hypothetical protein OG717_00035 [Streptomyces celluloflavus]WSK17294.1 hypothetical protein OG717_39440 [Streptomyces celluloflavus]